jgi:hypothetical protein
MKFLATLAAAAALLSGFALAAPSPDQNCPFGGNWNYCDVDGTYTVCVNGNPKWFSCTGGCQAICPPAGGSCQSRCDNGVPTSPPPGAEKRRRDWASMNPPQ